MSQTRTVLAWIVVLTIGTFGWTCCAWLLLERRQSEESQTELHRMIEDRDARHGSAERRLVARNAELSRRIGELESRIDELLAAQGGLAAIEERRRRAGERLVAMETKKKAAEVATATLALRHEVMKSRYAASEIASLEERQRRKLRAASPQPPATNAFREGLYAFASLKVSGPEREGEGDISITRQSVQAKSADDRPASAAAQSIKAAFKRSDALPQSLSRTDWADSQFELGQALAAEGRRRSGTRELKEAVLAFRAIVGEWSRKTAPTKWAMVRFELGRTLALLSRRSGEPSVRQEAIEALGSAQDLLIKAGEAPCATEAKRLLDEMQAETALSVTLDAPCDVARAEIDADGSPKPIAQRTLR